MNVEGTWVPFSVGMDLWDARALAADISDLRARSQAAEAVDSTLLALPHDPDASALAYARLAPKVKFRLAHPRDRDEKPINVTRFLEREDFEIQKIFRP